MTWKHMQDVVDHFDPDDADSALFTVLLCVSRYARVDGNDVYPSVGTLTKKTRLARSTVQKRLRSLERRGILQHTGDHPSGARKYRLDIRNLNAPDTSPPEGQPLPSQNPPPALSAGTKENSEKNTKNNTSSLVPETAREDAEEPTAVTEPPADESTTMMNHESQESRDDEEVTHSFTEPPQNEAPAPLPAGNRLPGDPPSRSTPRGPENGAQHPDPRMRDQWRPSDMAYETAQAKAPLVNLEVSITRYWMWCYEKNVDPSNTHWMRWVFNEQSKTEEAIRVERKREAEEARSEKPWYEKDLRH